MIKIEIVRSLVLEIKRKFNKAEANKIIDLMESLKDSPKKGKLLGTVGRVVIKEIKYKNFRFYFLTDGYKLKCVSEGKIVDLLLRFVRMSDNKKQQKTIDGIKHILQTLGPKGFE